MFNQHTYKTMDAMRRDMSRINNSVNNVNNMFTPGYKAQRANFQDTLNGVKAARQKDFSTGMPKRTDRNLDFAINGRGFFEVQMPDGSLAYTRNGSFKVSPNGELTSSYGYPLTNKLTVDVGTLNRSYDALSNGDTQKFDLGVLSKSINIPSSQDFSVDNKGNLVTDSGSKIGQLRLVTFPNLDGLVDVGNGLFVPGREAGEIEEVVVGDMTGETRIQQGFIESANTNMLQEMATIKETESVVQAHIKVLKMLDQMQESLNNTISRNI